jgi:hypothetical protein
MRFLPKAFLLFLPLFAVALPAQSVIPIATDQCVWHEGDDPSWAAPMLNESGWRPYAEWKPQFGLSRIWVRCHPDLSLLQSQPQPALQVSLVGAYQVYWNGQVLGGDGNLENGYSSADTMRSFPVPAGSLGSQPASVTLRINYRTLSLPSSGAAQRNFAPAVVRCSTACSRPLLSRALCPSPCRCSASALSA